MEPKVSIIIPVYNVEPFLARCLDSVVGQTLRGIEIICVDDGSPDRSIDILNRYAAQDDRIRIISQENRGLGGARNRGFDAATGEFILFVDSDDWIDPAYCERLYEAAREAVLDVCCSKGTYIRTLCHDLGEVLGCGGIMTSLVRTEAAGFTLADCRTLEEIQALVDEGRLGEALLPVEALFRGLPAIRLSPVQSRMFENGVRLDLNRVRHQEIPGSHAVYDSEGTFLGLAQCQTETEELVMEKLFIQRS